MIVGRIPHGTGRVWEYDPRARALDERLDRIDLELAGLRRLQTEDTNRALASLGYGVTLRPLSYPLEVETRVWIGEERRARAMARVGNVRRSATGRELLERRACGTVLSVR